MGVVLNALNLRNLDGYDYYKYAQYYIEDATENEAEASSKVS